MAPPAVSVIVPTVDRPQLLELALRSILAQTFADFEIVVVNDAGPPVADLVARVGGADPLRHPIRYVENAQRRGHGGARNAGLRVARGRYIAYLDDDDTFHPDHLATLLAALADGRHAVAYSDAAARQDRRRRPTVLGCDVPYASDFDADALLLTNYIPMLCVLHERACADAVAGAGGAIFDETLPVLEDWDLWIRLSRRYAFVRVPRVTCRFTVRTDGSSVTTQRLRTFAETEQLLRRRYQREIARAPRALQALYQSLLPGLRATLAGGQAARAAGELAAFVASYPRVRRGAPRSGGAARSLSGAQRLTSTAGSLLAWLTQFLTCASLGAGLAMWRALLTVLIFFASAGGSIAARSGTDFTPAASSSITNSGPMSLRRSRSEQRASSATRPRAKPGLLRQLLALRRVDRVLEQVVGAVDAGAVQLARLALLDQLGHLGDVVGVRARERRRCQRTRRARARAAGRYARCPHDTSRKACHARWLSQGLPSPGPSALTDRGEGDPRTCDACVPLTSAWRAGAVRRSVGRCDSQGIPSRNPLAADGRADRIQGDVSARGRRA